MKSGFLLACFFVFAVANPASKLDEIKDIAEPQEVDFSRDQREVDSFEDANFEREEREEEEDVDNDEDIDDSEAELERDDRDIDEDEELDDDEDDSSAELDRQDRATPKCKNVRIACRCFGDKLKRKLIVSLKLLKDYSNGLCKGKTFGLNWSNRRVWVRFGCKKMKCGKYTIKTCHRAKKCARIFYRKSITSFDMVKEHSKSACKKGESFGVNKNMIWVSKTCDAEFKVCYKHHSRIPIRKGTS